MLRRQPIAQDWQGRDRDAGARSAQWKVIQHVREARLPKRRLAGPKLLAHVLFAKYGLHLRLDRRSDIYPREGTDLDVSILADWVGASATTTMPLVDAIRSHASGVFFYSPARGGEHPDRPGMPADAYGGFSRLYQPKRKGGPIVEAARWAHGRRKFFDLARLSKAPIATEAVKRIDVLFASERKINGVAPQERLRVRQERSRPLIVELQAWLREQRAKLARNNDTTKAIYYCLSPLGRIYPLP